MCMFFDGHIKQTQKMSERSDLSLPDDVWPRGEIKSRQTGTLKCSKCFISLEHFGLGRPLTTQYEGSIEANRLTFNLIHLNNTNIY